jgi:hypothetical protein
LVLLLKVISFVPAQQYLRELEIKNPVMYGDDIKKLQRLLVNRGFSQIGDIDGYYGVLTRTVIDTIQTFLGFEANGKVNRTLWNRIFDENSFYLLEKISAVTKYNKAEMHKTIESREKYASRGGYIYKYFHNNELKIAELVIKARLYEKQYIIFFVDPFSYFILEQIHVYHLPDNDEEMAGYKGFYDFLYSQENALKSNIQYNTYFADEHVMAQYAGTAYFEATGQVQSIMRMVNSNEPWPSQRFERVIYTFEL